MAPSHASNDDDIEPMFSADTLGFPAAFPGAYVSTMHFGTDSAMTVIVFFILAIATMMFLRRSAAPEHTQPRAQPLGHAQPIRERRSPIRQRRSTRPEPATDERSGHRRRISTLNQEDAAGIARYPESLARAARGESVAHLPAVVHRNMRRPEKERVDFRQRVVEPFELSYFRAKCAALKRTTGEVPWWRWLAGDGIARALFDSVAGLLTGATDEARSLCTELLDTWLLQGSSDEFSAFRRELAELEERDTRVVTLDEIHAREADAIEFEFSKDWLLVSVLNTLMPTLRSVGVIAQPPRQLCPLCRIVMYDRAAPGYTKLVCHFPCGHWMCHSCFMKDVAVKADDGRAGVCAECNLESLPMVRDWPGAMMAA